MFLKLHIEYCDLLGVLGIWLLIIFPLQRPKVLRQPLCDSVCRLGS